MHMNTKRILPWLTAALLMASACSIDNVRETDDSRNDGDYVDVCLSVQPQGELRTRATYNKDGVSYVPSISQGKKVDMLIYAVYEVIPNDKINENEGKYRLLVQYGLGDRDNCEYSFGEGQTVLKPAFSEGETGGVEKIMLRLMRGREYAVAFWAQNHETEAFNTSDLRKVEVIYKDAKNNDEFRDAFCKVEVFRAAAGLSQTVILQRPFAQINVGTTGADYYNHLSFANQNYQEGAVKKSVLYSSITLTGVANFIDVVTDEISIIKTDNFDGTTATFAPAKIAAYLDVPDKELWDAEANNKLSLGQLIGSDDPDIASKPDLEPDPAQFFPSFVENEEFLMINLDDHGDSTDGYPQAHTENANLAGYLKYKTVYPTIDEKGGYLTETFKYLSMCYVLVPAAKVSDSDPEEEPAEKVSDPDSEKETSDPYRGSVINVSFKMGDNADLKNDDTKGLWCNEPITLTSVPVHRNWRTNILGGLDRKNTNYPQEGDDPSSLFEKKYIEATVYVSPSYDGDYNRKPGSGQEWSEDKKNASTETK